MASQTDLKTLMEFTGHSQVSTVMNSYVFATSESMTKAVSGMDQLRPSSVKPIQYQRIVESHKLE